jgi:hypothetical protein
VNHREVSRFNVRNVQRSPFSWGGLKRLKQVRRDRRWAAIGFTVIMPGVYDAPKTRVGNRKPYQGGEK